MSCLQRFGALIWLLKAILSRMLFAIHGLICIWRVYVMKKDPYYWLLVLTIGFLVLEGIFTLKFRTGGEWKWFCPSVFLYLATTIPAIWFLELDLLHKRMHYKEHGVQQPNIHELTELESEMQINIDIEPDDWVKILEQMLMLVLIVGRWLLPKGDISREQLSQLLLVYIGMAADIIELFEAFKEDAVKYNRVLIITTMAMWTGSLMQFTFVVTASKSRRPRPVIIDEDIVSPGTCCPIEVVSIFLSVILQDCPFFILRMTLICHFNVLSYSNIFFTSKNGLVLVLQIYRLVILYSREAKKTGSSDGDGSGSSGSYRADIESQPSPPSGGSKGLIAKSNKPASRKQKRVKAVVYQSTATLSDYGQEETQPQPQPETPPPAQPETPKRVVSKPRKKAPIIHSSYSNDNASFEEETPRKRSRDKYQEDGNKDRHDGRLKKSLSKAKSVASFINSKKAHVYSDEGTPSDDPEDIIPETVPRFKPKVPDNVKPAERRSRKKPIERDESEPGDATGKKSSKTQCDRSPPSSEDFGCSTYDIRVQLTRQSLNKYLTVLLNKVNADSK